ncbi:MAG: TadE/TadG family type IV pilus assembly protein [Acidimicrobiales bacterium]
MQRRPRDDKGQATAEFVILAIPIAALFILAIATGRWVEARQVATNAAQTAAESLALSPNGPTSMSIATQAAADVFAAHSLECGNGTGTQGSHGFPTVSAAVYPSGTVRVTVSCNVSTADAIFPGFAGIPGFAPTVDLTATAYAPVVPYKATGVPAP